MLWHFPLLSACYLPGSFTTAFCRASLIVDITKHAMVSLPAVKAASCYRHLLRGCPCLTCKESPDAGPVLVLLPNLDQPAMCLPVLHEALLLLHHASAHSQYLVYWICCCISANAQLNALGYCIMWMLVTMTCVCYCVYCVSKLISVLAGVCTPDTEVSGRIHGPLEGQG